MMIRLADWKESIFCDNEIVMASNHIMKAISNTIKKEYKNKLMVILFLIESKNTFKSFFTEL